MKLAISEGEHSLRVAVVGGGAAGYFAAIRCAEANPKLKVHLFEGTKRPLTKVRISGGGRCNVTHACFVPRILTKNYPRGEKELLGPFHHFQPQDTVHWFASRGVSIKREDDGRMFPSTNDSETIAGCLEQAARAAGVVVHLGEIVKDLRHSDANFFQLKLRDGLFSFGRVLLATGSAPMGHAMAQRLGHSLVDPVPSLFTFNIEDPRLLELGGISFADVELTLCPEGSTEKFVQRGPLLITHWGLNGPAVLKLSAWGARALHGSHYKAVLRVRFLRDKNAEATYEALRILKTQFKRKKVHVDAPFAEIPRRYWQRLLAQTGVPDTISWSDITRACLEKLAQQLSAAEFLVNGKGVFKEEFVTAGGISLHEVHFKTLESRICKGLYFSGEILDIDGITGGFNFQNAWTTAWIAGSAMATGTI